MPSGSRQLWLAVRSASLNEMRNAHASVGGSKRGRRYATQQINHAYLVLLSSQFQGFCRALHAECADLFVRSIPSATSPIIADLLYSELRRDRRLDRGNPSPGNIGSDFGRFRVSFWDEVKRLDPRNSERLKRLELLNEWRNAIAHQDFTATSLKGKITVQLADVERWRRDCDALAAAFDDVMLAHLIQELSITDW